MPLLPRRLEWSQRGMHAEEPVEIQNVPARNVNAGPQGVIPCFGVRHHDIETVGSAPLEDANQTFRTIRGNGHTPRSPGEESWHCRRADDGQSAVAQKNTTSESHKFVVETQLATSCLCHRRLARRRRELRLYLAIYLL